MIPWQKNENDSFAEGLSRNEERSNRLTLKTKTDRCCLIPPSWLNPSSWIRKEDISRRLGVRVDLCPLGSSVTAKCAGEKLQTCCYGFFLLLFSFHFGFHSSFSFFSSCFSRLSLYSSLLLWFFFLSSAPLLLLLLPSPSSSSYREYTVLSLSQQIKTIIELKNCQAFFCTLKHRSPDLLAEEGCRCDTSSPRLQSLPSRSH